MSDQTKFWIQTLIVPAVLAVMGFFINDTMQNQQRAFEKIKFANEVINEMFDSDTPDKALTLTNIIPVFVNDKEFSESFKIIISDYYVKKAEQALKTADVQQYRDISDAAAIFAGKGITITESLAKNAITKKAEEAHRFERQALVKVQQGDLQEAHTNFQKAENIYPGFESSSQMSNLLKDKISEVESGANKQEVKQQVLDSIKKKYSRNANSGSYRYNNRRLEP